MEVPVYFLKENAGCGTPSNSEYQQVSKIIIVNP